MWLRLTLTLTLTPTLALTLALTGWVRVNLAQRPLNEDRTERVVDEPIERRHEDLGRAARTLGREGLVRWRARVQDGADKALAALFAEVMALCAPATDAQVVRGQLFAAPATAADRGGRRRLAAAHADYE